jgi:ribonuclease D
MPSPPPEIMPEIVRDDITEQQLAVYLRSPEVAVDTETMGLRPLRDRLCVVQLYDTSGLAVLVQISPELLSSPAPRAPRLARLLEDPRALKVFHFARFDVATLRHHLGIQVAPLFCTRTASKLVRTYTNRHGLKDVTLELLDIDMDKTARHTDWSRPDLVPEQVRYAMSDVTTLLQLKAKLQSMLAREGREELAEECFRAIPTMARLDLLGFEGLFEH